MSRLGIRFWGARKGEVGEGEGDLETGFYIGETEEEDGEGVRTDSEGDAVDCHCH